MKKIVTFLVFLLAGNAQAVEMLSCGKIADGNPGLIPIWRCENSEVVCYAMGMSSQDAALSCKFKEAPVVVQPATKKKNKPTR